MASARYTLNIKPEDLKPDEPVELTAKQKRANFWYYNKWKLLAGLVVLLVLGVFIADVVGRVEPDINVTVVCQELIPEAVTTRLAEALSEAGLVPDLNGDGRQVAMVNQYNLNFDEGQQVDYATQMASSVKMVADLQQGESAVFLIDNPQLMGEYYDCLLPEQGAVLAPVSEASGLAALDLTAKNIATGQPEDGAEYIKDFTVVLRGFTSEQKADEKKAPRIQAGADLFTALTGVEP